MNTLRTEYVVDEQGHRKAVLISVDEWNKILDNLEELDDIHAYDDAKKHPSKTILFEEAIKEIKAGK